MNDIIIKYLQGDASENEKQIILNWLKTGEANKKTFSEIRDRWLAAGATPVTAPGYVEQAFARFTAQVGEQDRKRKQLRNSYYMKVAASVAILLICSLGSYFAGQKHFFSPSSSKQLVMNRAIMGKDSKGAVTLPDGTTVWLNANSVLVYPEHFQAGKRHVQLEGEGYVEVMRNEKAPFLVETDGMVVNVLGTHFNVSNYKGKETVETTLVSGKVEVFLPGLDKSIILKPNQKISCNRRNGAYKLDDVDASDYIIWIGDKLVCTNEKLSTVLHKMKHWYNMDVECKNGVLLDQRLSLTIRKESPEEILKLLALISPIRYTIEKDKIIISPK